MGSPSLSFGPLSTEEGRFSPARWAMTEAEFGRWLCERPLERSDLRDGSARVRWAIELEPDASSISEHMAYYQFVRLPRSFGMCS